jgi:hypothetical protein
MLMAKAKAKPRPQFDPDQYAFCTHCEKVKPRDAFPKSRQNKNGLHYWCKTCNNAATKKWADDPANYRKRRDTQALSNRRYRGSTKVGPVQARKMAP